MATHSSTLAWKIPWKEEPGGLQSIGSLSRTWLSNFTYTFHFHALEKEMATHSSVLAWSIPGTGEPGGLPSMGSHRVGHDWSDLAAAANIWKNSLFIKTFYILSTFFSFPKQCLGGAPLGSQWRWLLGLLLLPACFLGSSREIRLESGSHHRPLPTIQTSLMFTHIWKL